MNLVAYSLKTKGVTAFSRRLWTVFTRFGVSEGRTRRSLISMVEAVRPYAFDRIYGGWWQPVLRRDARAVVERSAERYIQWLRGEAEDR